MCQVCAIQSPAFPAFSVRLRRLHGTWIGTHRSSHFTDRSNRRFIEAWHNRSMRRPATNIVPLRAGARSGRRQQPGQRWRISPGLRPLLPALGLLAALLVASAVYLITSPFPLAKALQHLAAAPNCMSARVWGLAPARVGQPGYWIHHDRDLDGIACEPWRR